MQRLIPAQLKEYLDKHKPMLLDVREPWEYDICHIDGSINVPMGRIAEQVEDIRSQPEIVVICHHGVRSMQVIQFLTQQSLTGLINLDGGVDAWARQVDLNMPLY